MTADTRYLVRISRTFYAGTLGAARHTYVDSDGVPVHLKSWQYVRPFASRKAALDWIAEMDSGVYLQGNGECGRPRYYVVPESRWPESITS